MSFGFRVLEDRWEQRTRTLVRVDLVEISVVPEAAYPDTNSALRHGGGAAWHQRRLELARRSST